MNFNNGFRITGNDAATSNFFGTSVSINSVGNIALIGAYGANGSAGAAYIFTGGGNNWIQTAKITGNDSASQDFLVIA